jgi:hypothetical protein
VIGGRNSFINKFYQWMRFCLFVKGDTDHDDNGGIWTVNLINTSDFDSDWNLF